MSDESIKKSPIEGVLMINRQTFTDERGFFKETFRLNDLEEASGIKFNIIQQNHSRSKMGTLRGIHIAPWNKLVYCVNGMVQEVVVDLRKGSPTFGQNMSINIGEDNKMAVFIPKGCGNAFQVLSDEADYTYLTDDYWAAGKEQAVAWDDPELDIDWLIVPPTLSEKDQENMSLQEFQGHE
jgi:dTDP-4-dehydrorhamnose 3,5-epimerase